MNRKNWFVICGIAVFSLLLLALVPLLPKEAVTEDTVVIRLGNTEYARIPLSQPQTLTISQENGAVNVVEITENGMRMVSSTCQNQICVHRGWITIENWELMGGAFISCLPNQVLLELLEAP